MVEISLRLEAVRPSAFDACLARVGTVRLTRADGITYLQTERLTDDATYQLALAGVRVAHGARVPAPAAGMRPAIAFDLTTLDSRAQLLDIVEVRPISLGEASAALMHLRLPWSSASRTARDACRRLLRDEDAVLAWRRVLWCSTASLRSARSRLRVRPVVFDRSALDRHAPRWTYVRDGAIERWAFS